MAVVAVATVAVAVAAVTIAAATAIAAAAAVAVVVAIHRVITLLIPKYSSIVLQILPTAQRLLDELLSSQESVINSVSGAPGMESANKIWKCSGQ